MAINSPKLRGSKTVSVAEVKPKRTKIQDLSLDELYEQEKITPTVLKAILAKEDFSEIRPRYCEKVCKLPCSMKRPLIADQNTDPADVIIIQDHRAGPDGWKTAGQVNQLQQQQIAAMSRLAFGRDVHFKVLNLVKCPNLDGDDRAKLTATQMLTCAPYLWEEIRQTNPKAIVSMSTEVTKALGLAKKSNYKNRGEFYHAVIPGMEEPIPAVLTLHAKVLNMLRQNASGQMYGADYTSVIINDLAKVRLIMDGKVQVGGLEQNLDRIIADQVFVTTSLDQVKDAMEDILRLPPNQIISWDLETTGLDPWAEDARILTSQFGYRRADGKVQAIVVPLWHKDQKYYDPAEAWEFIKPVLLSQRAKVGHNVKFDILYCTITTGVRPQGRIFDTMFMLHSLNSGIQGNYGLKAAMWDHVPHLGIGGYEELLDQTLDADDIKRLLKEEKGGITEEDSDDETED
jgi:hypothetical protein